MAGPTVAASAVGTTPFCDIYCVLFFDKRLHSITCDAANRMDPIFPDRKIDDVLHPREWIGEEGNE